MNEQEEQKTMNAAASLAKPPLGLIPRRIAQDKRLGEIDDAIRRYLAAGFTIPQEWLAEREDLLA